MSITASWLILAVLLFYFAAGFFLLKQCMGTAALLRDNSRQRQDNDPEGGLFMFITRLTRSLTPTSPKARGQTTTNSPDGPWIMAEDSRVYPIGGFESGFTDGITWEEFLYMFLLVGFDVPEYQPQI